MEMIVPDFSSPERNKESWPPTFSPFRMPLEPLLKVLTRNYLWGETEEHTKVPHISWANTCKAKKHGGTGIKDYVAWNKATISKLHRLPTKARLNQFIPQSDLQCLLCNNAVEEDTHLSTECPYAIEVRESLMQWWPIPCCNTYTDLAASPSRYRAPKAQKQILCAIFAVAIYVIQYTRNQLLLKNHRAPAQQTVNMIKEKIRHRILFLNTLSCTYSKHMDSILR
ncbi:hypothetical protein Cgig2_020051 [Carnegiea gigantea]|uniref:Reverse transcriptase zinc-binding domain-containing protein n=1 Tax=Carnegiea gigantea TaxID=171969 RepID=A0A9Q1JK22_9CARY|nr:hypothetical protein Cgig2_020051 [Carnegiea gigantea]